MEETTNSNALFSWTPESDIKIMVSFDRYVRMLKASRIIKITIGDGYCAVVYESARWAMLSDVCLHYSYNDRIIYRGKEYRTKNDMYMLQQRIERDKIKDLLDAL